MSERERGLRRFEVLHRRLSRLLYDYDPDGMGSTVHAPLDEYDDVAVSLLRALRDMDVSQDLGEVALDVVPGATGELVREVETLWAELSVPECGQ